jgi:hypothetical protein
MAVVRYVVALALAVAVTGCGDARSTCDAAVAEAAEIAGTQDVVTQLDRAIEQCASADEFEAAVAQFPDALDDEDARTFLSGRCADEPAIADTAICTELSQ